MNTDFPVSNNSGLTIFVSGIESGVGGVAEVAAARSSEYATTAKIIVTEPFNKASPPVIFITVSISGRSTTTGGC